MLQVEEKSDSSSSRIEKLSTEELICRAIKGTRRYLPEQGPIGVFVHHNTLHHFESSRFEDAVESVAEILGAEPYMAHDAYVKSFVEGRISKPNLKSSIEQNLKEGTLSSEIPRTFEFKVEKFYRKLLFIPSIHECSGTIQHLLDEGGYLREFVPQVSEHSRERIRKQSETLLSHGDNRRVFSDAEIDEYSLRKLWNWLSIHYPKQVKESMTQSSSFRFEADQLVNDRLTCFLNAYSDKGISYWKMPSKKKGLLKTFIELFSNGNRFSPGYFVWANPSDLAFLSQKEKPEECLVWLIQKSGVSVSELEAFIQYEILKLPGWAGTVSLFEQNPSQLPSGEGDYSLLEFLVVRLLLLSGASKKGVVPASQIVVSSEEDLTLSSQFEAFLLFQSLGVGMEDLKHISKSAMEGVARVLGNVTEFKRRRILHQAYEHSYKTQIMDSISINAQRSVEVRKTPCFQALFCIDDREESLRRHLEEIEPSCETLGVAGFFGLDIRFRGINDHDPVPLCPVAVDPNYIIEEVPAENHRKDFDVANNRRGLLQKTARNIYDYSRDFFGGTLFTVLAGILSCIPMFFRIHFPRLTGRFLEKLHHHFFPKVESEINIERKEDGAKKGNKLLFGFTNEEMATRVFGVLAGAGMRSFASVVFVIGHGSSSLNNPHESAHDCGACGGRRGGPNARAFAKMANLPSVRKILIEKGLNIPETTYFVGGYHDTCSDDLNYFELNRVPTRLKEQVEAALESFDRARTFDAHERCRRFEDAKDYSPSLALRHVQGRSQNLREPRPEYGHCTNSICIVGRRTLTRELFLDRRAFLVSYDPATDENASILSSVLSAVIPVCAGINLEYYFSFVDNEVYGCGTKLPHNVTGLIGVMNGSLSDLRTGLPWQMVEIHEPVRLVTIVEASISQVEEVFKRVPLVKDLVEKRWIQLGVLSPGESEPIWYEGLEKIPNVAQTKSLAEFSTSRSYYSNKIHHLSPVLITQRKKT